MTHEAKIHPVQIRILRDLLFVPSASFAELQKTTGLESDHFKFHLARLVDVGYVDKHDGHYRLTPKGKEYANKLDTDSNTVERQPKSAVILFVEKPGPRGQLYLVQERLKHPYYGFYGFPTGKIRWGETILQAAARELMEETALQATLTYRGVYHEHILHEKSGELLEDKIFFVVHGQQPRGTLLEQFEGGRNQWLTHEQVMSKAPKIYKSVATEFALGQGDESFVELTYAYDDEQF